MGRSPSQIIWFKRSTKPHGILIWTTPHKTSKYQITVIVIKYIICYVYIDRVLQQSYILNLVKLFTFSEHVKENNVFNLIHFFLKIYYKTYNRVITCLMNDYKNKIVALIYTVHSH